MSREDCHPNEFVAERAEKKPYTPPRLREYGNVSELTQGTGLVLLDVLVQGSLTVTVTG